MRLSLSLSLSLSVSRALSFCKRVVVRREKVRRVDEEGQVHELGARASLLENEELRREVPAALSGIQGLRNKAKGALRA